MWVQVGIPDALGDSAVKKFTTAALAALIATGSMATASAADAQSRYDRGDRLEQRQDRPEYRRDDRQDDRRDNRDDRREWRQDRRDDRQDYRQQARAYDRWQRAERRYYAGRYQAPRGYQYQQWGYGQRLPSHYTRGYVINDYNRYGLRAPPRGYQYVRNGNDVVLAAVAGGLITAVIAGLFN
jgi:Ni/Co efflux regulator RcnB